MSALDKIYAAVTSEILAALEAGTAPWNKPWSGTDAALNSRGNPYRGYNQMILSFIRGTRKYTSNVWITWNQVKALGGSLKEGRGKECVNVIFYTFLQKKDAKPGDRGVPLLRYYRVYNLDETENVKLPARTVKASTACDTLEFTPIEACEKIAANYPNAPTLVNREAQAYYRPATDEVNMPRRETFRSVTDYYATLFHEFGHSTGAEKRLARKTLTDMAPFGSATYSQEELVAEMTAAMLCGVAGIQNDVIGQNAAYIKGWLRKLKEEPGLLLKAAGQAQKAADHILNAVREEEEE